MKLGSPLAQRKARIEIVPLIDIMFFLLASFMLVSLSMIQMRGMKINMPSAATSTPEQKPDFLTVTIDLVGDIFFEKEKVDLNQLSARLKQEFAKKADTKIYIRGDKDATHGAVISVLDRVKQSGITKVAFEIRPVAPASEAIGQPGVPSPSSVPSAPIPPTAPTIPVPPTAPAPTAP